MKGPAAEPRACTISDVLHELRMSRSTFDRLMKRRELALVELERLGRVRRFTRDSLNRVLRSRWAPKELAS